MTKYEIRITFEVDSEHEASDVMDSIEITPPNGVMPLVELYERC